tara:strand:+ start:1101 stop:2015 length:915 start_codon:yes stop_codon:yes gene_type:complete
MNTRSKDEPLEDNSTDMTIYPIKDDPTKPIYREVGEPLLKPPFTYAFVGFRGSSKTTTLMNLILRPYPFYGASDKVTKDKKTHPVFDNIFVISPTIGLDSTSKPLLKVVPPENIFTDYSDSMIDQILLYQKNQEPPREKTLIICDDILGLSGKGLGPNSKIYRLPAVLRHYDCSVCYLVQLLRGGGSLPPITRNNIEGWFLYKNPNSKEIDKMGEEFGAFGGKENFFRLYRDAVMAKPYSFLFLDSRKYVAYSNLQTLMWSKYDENGNFNPLYKANEGEMDLKEIDPNDDGKKELELSKDSDED